MGRKPPRKKKGDRLPAKHLPVKYRTPERERMEELEALEEEMRARGPSKGMYNPERTPREAFNIVRHTGCGYRELAQMLGVDQETLRDWRHRFPRLCDAITLGRDWWNADGVEESLLARAKGYEYDEVRVEQVEVPGEYTDEEGHRVEVKVPATKYTRTRKHVPPETAAIKYYLNNRRRDRWRETKVIAVTPTTGSELDVLDTPLEAVLENLGTDELEQMERLLEEGKADGNGHGAT